MRRAPVLAAACVSLVGCALWNAAKDSPPDAAAPFDAASQLDSATPLDAAPRDAAAPPDAAASVDAAGDGALDAAAPSDAGIDAEVVDPSEDAGEDAADSCSGAICGGQCVNTQIDQNNCGFCEVKCGQATCTEGSCLCPQQTPTLCEEGICADLGRNEEHCGNCATSCGPSELCLLSACCDGQPPDIPESAIAIWHCDDGNETLTDSVSAAMDGTIEGIDAPDWIEDGRYDLALSFTDTDNVSITVPADLSFPGSTFTVEAWFRLRSTRTDDPCLVQSHYDDVAENSYTPFCLGVSWAETGTNVFFAVHLEGAAQAIRLEWLAPDLVDSDWHHAAGVIDESAAEWRLYVDGERRIREDADWPASPMPSEQVILGRSIDGDLDEIRIGRAALTDEDARLSYCTPAGD